MRRIFWLILAALFFGGWLLAAAALHVVVLPGKDGESIPAIGLLPKNHLGFTDTYVDARAWTPADAAGHPDLLLRISEAGRAAWLSKMLGVSEDESNAKLQELLRPADPAEKHKAKATH